MGVEPFLISSAVLGVVGQRLVRTVCPSCRELVPAELADKAALDLVDIKIARGAGCGRCGNRGMKGRTAVYEIMSMSDTLRSMVLKQASGAELKSQAIAEGMTPMRSSGRQKVIDNVTTPEEVLRVLYTED
jgi:type IV pilus assembly protein PilB